MQPKYVFLLGICGNVSLQEFIWSTQRLFTRSSRVLILSFARLCRTVIHSSQISTQNSCRLDSTWTFYWMVKCICAISYWNSFGLAILLIYLLSLKLTKRKAEKTTSLSIGYKKQSGATRPSLPISYKRTKLDET